MTTDTTGTNGLLISPDWSTLYMIQTNPERRELRAYAILADGSLGPYIVLHQFGDDYRGPQRGIDGMCLDAEGNIVATAGSYASGPGPMIYVWDSARSTSLQVADICSGPAIRAAAVGSSGRRYARGRAQEDHTAFTPTLPSPVSGGG